MKKIKLTEVERLSNLEKLSNNELHNLIGAGCGSCCGSTGSEYRQSKRAVRQFNDDNPGPVG